VASQKRSRTTTQTWAPLPGLEACLHSVVVRDTRRVELPPEDRFTYGSIGLHFSVTWYLVGSVEQFDGWHPDDLSQERRPVEPRVVFSGARSRPWMTYAPAPSFRVIAVFYADAVQALFGLDPREWVDRSAAFDARLVAPELDAWARAVLKATNGRDAVEAPVSA
jgi:hypothetical protein